MVRVASLDSFPRGSVSREFYSYVPVASEDLDSTQRERKYQDRMRKRRARAEAKERRAGMPAEILTLFRKNGGEV